MSIQSLLHESNIETGSEYYVIKDSGTGSYLAISDRFKLAVEVPLEWADRFDSHDAASKTIEKIVEGYYQYEHTESLVVEKVSDSGYKNTDLSYPDEEKLDEYNLNNE